MDESSFRREFNEIWIQQLSELSETHGISLIELASTASNLSRVSYLINDMITGTLSGGDAEFPDKLYNIFKALQVLAIEFNETYEDIFWEEDYDDYGNEED